MALVPQERELHPELWGLELEEECFPSKRAAADRRKVLHKGHSGFLMEQNRHLKGFFIKKKSNFCLFIKLE